LHLHISTLLRMDVVWHHAVDDHVIAFRLDG
jgi:hypothetical protein